MADLVDADEIFLTSSGVGVAPVTTFDFRRYAIEPESIVNVVRQAFNRLTQNPDS
jgi:branched-subunit amino acid aminotransferase/4-amino-4-deoxychorismate lyase